MRAGMREKWQSADQALRRGQPSSSQQGMTNVRGWTQNCWACERLTTEKQPLQELVLLGELVLLLCASHGSDVVALTAFPTPVELQKQREVHHGREKKVHAEKGQRT